MKYKITHFIYLLVVYSHIFVFPFLIVKNILHWCLFTIQKFNQRKRKKNITVKTINSLFCKKYETYSFVLLKYYIAMG